MNTNIRIYQSSYFSTGSTLLTNLIYGFLDPDKSTGWGKNFEEHICLKTHTVEMNTLLCNKRYNIYIISSERRKKYPKNYYKNTDKVLIIKYDEILETENNTLKQICTNICKKFLNFLPNEVQMSISEEETINNMIKRIQNMNKKIEELKDKDFNHFETFFGVHGSHRNRKPGNPGYFIN